MSLRLFEASSSRSLFPYGGWVARVTGEPLYKAKTIEEVDQIAACMLSSRFVGEWERKVIVARFDSWEHIAVDLFFPSFALKRPSDWATALALAVLDLCLVIVRIATLLPRYIYCRMHPKTSHPLYRFLRDHGVAMQPDVKLVDIKTVAPGQYSGIPGTTHARRRIALEPAIDIGDHPEHLIRGLFRSPDRRLEERLYDLEMQTPNVTWIERRRRDSLDGEREGQNVSFRSSRWVERPMAAVWAAIREVGRAPCGAWLKGDRLEVVFPGGAGPLAQSPEEAVLKAADPFVCSFKNWLIFHYQSALAGSSAGHPWEEREKVLGDLCEAGERTVRSFSLRALSA